MNLVKVRRNVPNESPGRLVDGDGPPHSLGNGVLLNFGGRDGPTHLLSVDLLERFEGLVARNVRLFLSCCDDGRLIHEVHKLGTGESRRCPGQLGKVHVRVDFLVTGMHLKDTYTAFHVG